MTQNVVVLEQWKFFDDEGVAFMVADFVFYSFRLEENWQELVRSNV